MLNLGEEGAMETRVVVCSGCGKRNRVAGDEERRVPVCGFCKTPLLKPGLTELNGAVFERFLQGDPKPLLIDFYAPWCVPCRAMAPVLEALAASHPELRVGKVNVDQEMGLAERYGVASVPTLLFFREGRVEERQTGILSLQALERLIQEWGRK